MFTGPISFFEHSRAHIGIGMAAVIFLSASSKILPMVLERTNSPVRHNWYFVRQLCLAGEQRITSFCVLQWQRNKRVAKEMEIADVAYQRALGHITKGVELAEQTDSLTVRVQGLHVLLKLYFQMVRHINQRLREPMGSSDRERQEKLRKKQESIIDQAKTTARVCMDVLAIQARRWS